MAKVYVGSARIDENGKAYGGKAGDQTKKEVSTQSYYVHSKRWRVFRAKDREDAKAIAKCMQMACDNNKIGYDQWQRNTLYTKAEKVGFDVSKVTSACETDCSALVRVCCAYAGIMGLPSDFRTGNMPSNLLKTGKFIELKGDKYTKKSTFLGAGDILITRTSGHTVVVMNDGDKYEGEPVEEVIVLGDRLLKNGCEGEDVKQLQTYLIQMGYDCGKWGADGDYGDATEMAVIELQKDLDVEADGDYGSITHKAFMLIIGSKKEDEPVTEAKHVNIVGGNCWMRSEPNTAGKKICVLKNGTKVDYANETSIEGWNKVNVDGEIGWVSGKYSKVI